MRQRSDVTRAGVPLRGRGLRRRQEDERRRGRNISASSEDYSAAIQIERLQKYQKKFATSGNYEKMLEELEAYRFKEGAPPMPQTAADTEETFHLKLGIPRYRRATRVNPREVGVLPETPRSAGQADGYLVALLSGRR